MVAISDACSAINIVLKGKGKGGGWGCTTRKTTKCYFLGSGIDTFLLGGLSGPHRVYVTK